MGCPTRPRRPCSAIDRYARPRCARQPDAINARIPCKQKQINSSKMAWIYLILFFRIETFQRVAANSNEKFRPPVSGCTQSVSIGFSLLSSGPPPMPQSAIGDFDIADDYSLKFRFTQDNGNEFANSLTAAFDSKCPTGGAPLAGAIPPALKGSTARSRPFGDIRWHARNVCNSRRHAIRTCEEFGDRAPNGEHARPLPAAGFPSRTQSATARPLVRQPVRHLRKDGAPVERAARVPRKALRCAGLSEHAQEFGAHLVRIGAIDRRRPLRRPEAPAGFRRTGPVDRGLSWRAAHPRLAANWSIESARWRGLLRRRVVRCPRLLFTILAATATTGPATIRSSKSACRGSSAISRPSTSRSSADPRYIRRASRRAGSFRAARAAACRRSAASCGRAGGS